MGLNGRMDLLDNERGSDKRLFWICIYTQRPWSNIYLRRHGVVFELQDEAQGRVQSEPEIV